MASEIAHELCTMASETARAMCTTASKTTCVRAHYEFWHYSANETLLWALTITALRPHVCITPQLEGDYVCELCTVELYVIQ